MRDELGSEQAATVRLEQQLERPEQAVDGVRRVARVAAQRAAGLPSVPSTLAEEKATNPFLRCGEPAVVAAALARGAVDRSPTAVFAAIRGWRNTF